MIRRAKLEDIRALHALNRDELGYEYPMKETRKNLERIIEQNSGHVLLVYEQAGKVLAYVHGHSYQTLYFPALLNVLALAISSKHQGEWIGRQLLDALEKVAIEQGLYSTRVKPKSNPMGAHRLNEQLAIESNKKQSRYLR